MSDPAYDERRETLVVRGHPRTFTVLMPRRRAEVPAIVLLFHGSNQTGATMRAASGNQFDHFVEAGAFVAYLDGYQRHWNDARVSTNFATRSEGFDDVAFAMAVIDSVAVSNDVDLQRVFVIGYSNGGQLVFRLLHEVPSRLAGAAVISATQPVPWNFLPSLQPEPPGQVIDDPDAVAESAHPVPVLLIHGTEDAIIPYAGGMTDVRRGEGLSAPQTAAYYATRNGIHRTPETTLMPLRSESAAGTPPTERTLYADRGHPPVVLYTVHGGGHAMPTPQSVTPHFGHRSGGIDAAGVIGEFFGLTR